MTDSTLKPPLNEAAPDPAPFLIYGKHRSQKRFRPMDLSRGVQVVNLIFASRLTAAEKDRFLATAPSANPDWQFESRHR